MCRMRHFINDPTKSDVRIDKVNRHTDTMVEAIRSEQKEMPSEEAMLTRTDSLSKLTCHCPTTTTPKPRVQRTTLKKFHKMSSISKAFQEESVSTKDTPAVKGILTLVFCIVYAAVLFILAAVLSRVVVPFGKSAATVPGVKVKVWETESQKHTDLRQSRLVHTRWGQ